MAGVVTMPWVFCGWRIKAIAVGMPITEPPRTDPGERDSRTGLPPLVFDGEALARPGMKDPDCR
jgi:hypothetical protein